MKKKNKIFMQAVFATALVVQAVLLVVMVDAFLKA